MKFTRYVIAFEQEYYFLDATNFSVLSSDWELDAVIYQPLFPLSPALPDHVASPCPAHYVSYPYKSGIWKKNVLVLQDVLDFKRYKIRSMYFYETD